MFSGAPPNVSYIEVKCALNEIRGVKEIHNLRIWSLTVNKVALAVHLAIGEFCNSLCLQTLQHRDRN